MQREAGVFTVDRALVDRLNAIDPAITLATVAEFKPVERGDMVATVKIIPSPSTARWSTRRQRFSPRRKFSPSMRTGR